MNEVSALISSRAPQTTTSAIVNEAQPLTGSRAATSSATGQGRVFTNTGAGQLRPTSLPHTGDGHEGLRQQLLAAAILALAVALACSLMLLSMPALPAGTRRR